MSMAKQTRVADRPPKLLLTLPENKSHLDPITISVYLQYLAIDKLTDVHQLLPYC